MKKGLFIAVYGVNNIGKSTHCRILCEKLRKEGHEVVQLKYPIYDLEPTGPLLNSILRGGFQGTFDLETMKRIDDYNKEDALQALFTQNRRDFEPTLQKYLDEGKIVVAEDYIGTGIAWGMAKGLSLEFMEKLNEGLLKEDFAILMTGQRDTKATEQNHIHEQNSELLTKVTGIFGDLAERYGWKKIKLQPTIDETAHLIWKVTQLVLEIVSSD